MAKSAKKVTKAPKVDDSSDDEQVVSPDELIARINSDTPDTPDETMDEISDETETETDEDDDGVTFNRALVKRRLIVHFSRVLGSIADELMNGNVTEDVSKGLLAEFGNRLALIRSRLNLGRIDSIESLDKHLPAGKRGGGRALDPALIKTVYEARKGGKTCKQIAKMMDKPKVWVENIVHNKLAALGGDPASDAIKAKESASKIEGKIVALMRIGGFSREQAEKLAKSKK